LGKIGAFLTTQEIRPLYDAFNIGMEDGITIDQFLQLLRVSHQ